MYVRSDRPGRPFRVQYRDEDGRQRSPGFVSEEEQIRFAKGLAKRLRVEGRSVLSVDPARWEAFLRLEAEAGGFEGLSAAVRLWQERGVRLRGMDLSRAGCEFLELKEREGISHDSWLRYKKLLERLGSAFPGARVDEFDGVCLTGWLESLRASDGRVFEAVTRNNWRTWAKAFFEFCKRRGWVVENPVGLVPRWREVERPVGILSPEEGARLFAANGGRPCVGRLALEAFAGLRYSSAKRIRREQINFEDRGIVLPGEDLKTRRRVYVDGFPENLWGWLEAAPVGCWDLTERQYQEEKRLAFVRAGIGHPKNCLRHSFATYHVALVGNVGKTATLLCHTNLATLNRFYRGNATRREGGEWFEIRPDCKN